MIYLDGAASAEMSKSALAAYIKAAEEHFANTASAHGAGLSAELELEKARSTIAESIGAEKNCIVFTSSGTEANNLALFGSVNLFSPRGRIISSAAEHDSVYAPLKRLSELGFDVVLIPVENGELDMDKLSDALDENTVLVSVIHTNNETGAVFDIPAVAKLIDERFKNSRARPVFHTDMVQSYGKIPLSVKELGVGLASVSSHKIGGGKGAGALYIKKGIKISPQILGGGHESGLRSSTVNLPQIAAFAEAAEERRVKIGENRTRVAGLRAYAEEKLKKQDCFKVNNFKTQSDYILSLTVRNVKSEVMLNFLSSKGVYISAGSACSAKKSAKDATRVLTAFGFSRSDADFTVRISFSEKNSEAEIDVLYDLLAEGVKRYSVK